MRKRAISQGEVSGPNARGHYQDLTNYDEKPVPSPRAPRPARREAMRRFTVGFFNELEKEGVAAALATRGVASAAGKGGFLRGLGSSLKAQAPDLAMHAMMSRMGAPSPPPEERRKKDTLSGGLGLHGAA